MAGCRVHVAAMYFQRALLVGAALVGLVGCGDDDASPSKATAISCGAGTTLQGATCIANDAGAPSSSGNVTPPSDAGTVTCGTGTVLSGTQCIVGPAAQIASARLTFLDLHYDTTKPALLDSPLEVTFGVTSQSADNTKPATSRVAVLFSFVEENPADPKNPGVCSSNSILADLVGNGSEQKFQAKIFPTSLSCTFVKAPTKVNLAVDFDQGLAKSNKPTGIDYPPVVFNAATQSAGDNQKCRKSDGATQGLGCVYELTIQSAPAGSDGKPMVNATLDTLTPQSSVAILPAKGEDAQVPTGKSEADMPAVSVDAVIFLDGRDPYQHKIDPTTIPAEYAAAHPDVVATLSDAGLDSADDLPAATGGGAPAIIRYDIVAKSKIAPDAWLPLQIDDPKNPDPDGLVDEIDISEIEPGAETHLTHDLFITGATRDAVTGTGVWANESEFVIRGCLVANFPEAEDPGDMDDSDDAVGGDVKDGDCKTFPVVLVKTGPATTAASAETFNNSFSRTIGDPGLVALIGQLSTTNSLDTTGARTDTQAFVDLKGHIGTDFSTRLFNAYAKGGATTQSPTGSGATYVDVAVEIFGNNVFGYQNNSNNSSFSQDFKVAKQIEFPGLGWTFGPVTIGISAGVGGEVGITPTLNISAQGGGDASVPELANASVSGTVNGTVDPHATLTGFVKGGIDIFIASATVQATVSIIDVHSPVQANLRWGVTGSGDGKITAMTSTGNVTWNLVLTWLNVTVDAVGAIGPCPFCVSETINICKFTNTPETIPLLNRQIGATVLN